MSRQRASTEIAWFLACAAVALVLTFGFGGRYVLIDGFFSAFTFVPFSVQDPGAWCVAAAILACLVAVRVLVLLVLRRVIR